MLKMLQHKNYNVGKIWVIHGKVSNMNTLVDSL